MGGISEFVFTDSRGDFSFSRDTVIDFTALVGEHTYWNDNKEKAGGSFSSYQSK